jgi:preprotein translocase subunit SecA
LVHLDWCWSDHLAHAGEIREGIYLVSHGGFNAMDVFNRKMNREFGAFQRELKAHVVETLSTATFTADGIDLAEGCRPRRQVILSGREPQSRTRFPGDAPFTTLMHQPCPATSAPASLEQRDCVCLIRLRQDR